MSVVVDASLVVALVVGDERQDAARAHLERWLSAGDRLHAPAVLPYEVANVLARLVFDGIVQIDDVPEIWNDLDALGVVLHPFDLNVDGPDVAKITNRLRRRHATDSTYISLARRLETTLWTLDRALARNAATSGFPVALVT